MIATGASVVSVIQSEKTLGDTAVSWATNQSCSILHATRGEPYFLGPQAFGEALFGKYALAVQVVCFQLLFAAVGAFTLGRVDKKGESS